MVRTKPLLEKCCYCMTLRSGSLLAGILAIVMAIIAIIIFLTVRIQLETFFFNWLSLNVRKIIIIINLIMTIILTSVMMIGVMKRNMYLMVPWVMIGIILVIGSFISVIWNAIVIFIDGFILTGFLALIIGIIMCVIYLYFWAVVYSHFAELKEEEERGRYSKQPYRR